MRNVILTDSRGYRWVYTPEGLRLHRPAFHFLPVDAREEPAPRLSWWTRLWTWLSEAPAHDRW